MSTVSKKIADDIIAGKYPDEAVIRIVRYMTPEGEEAFGVIHRGEHAFRYHTPSPYVINPTTYWEAP